jgi:hypothetical protein
VCVRQTDGATLYNPLQGGILISTERYFQPAKPATGTLGAIVVDDASGPPLMLTNYHVICGDDLYKTAIEDLYRNVHQPPRDYPIPLGKEGLAGKTVRGILDTRLDGAVASIIRRDVACRVVDIGVLTGLGPRRPHIGFEVRKRGAYSGLTFGSIDGFDVSAKIKFPEGGPRDLYGAFSIKGLNNANFAVQGDSGSAIVAKDSGLVVGLLFAINEADGGKTGYALPIRRVLYALKVSAMIGIGGFDLTSTRDRALAFDYRSTGRQDHLVFYRPGSGTATVLEKAVGRYDLRLMPGLASEDEIQSAGKDLIVVADVGGVLRFRIFDREGQHRGYFKENLGHDEFLIEEKVQMLGELRDRLRGLWPPHVLARSEKDSVISAVATIFGRNVSSFLGSDPDADRLEVFTPVFGRGSSDGIGDYDLSFPDDRAIAFDLESRGNLDHLVLYRPGTGMIHIKKFERVSAFTRTIRHVFTSASGGIGGYDLRSPNDQLVAFDYEGNGRLDHLVAYRAGQGICWVLRHEGDKFRPIYKTVASYKWPNLL